jgi:hypothetical protein
MLGGAVAALILAASVLFAKPGVVVTNDGQRLEGEITEKGDEVTVNIRGINTVLSRGNIASITYAEPFEKEFQDRMAKLDPKDVKGRIELARWAFDQKHYPAARDALESALTIDPNNREAADLERLVRSQMRLEQTKQATPAPPTTKPMTPEKPAPTNAAGQKLLTAADINAIRQAELRPSDTRTSIRLENNVEKRYIQYANLQFSEFNAKSPVDRAIDILDKGDPSMRKDVKIVTDPASLIEFKSMIQPMILNGCAASNCHGGSKGGSLQLLAPASSDAVTYTNFYILTQYHKKLSDPTGGVFEGNVERKMIDRGHGADSILAQYMLPADVSRVDHPKVPGYNGVARNKDDVRFRQLVNWMDNSLSSITPNYGITYELPFAGTTRPSTTQTTEPAGPTRR